MNEVQTIRRGPDYVTVHVQYTKATGTHALYAAKTLDEAYGAFNGVPAPLGGPLLVGEVLSPGGVFRSDSRAKAQHYPKLESSNIFDYAPQDFHSTSPNYPSNQETAFLRAVPLGLTPTGQGPISVHPPFGWTSVARPALTLYGTAPNLAAAAPGMAAPVESMHLKFPAYADSLLVKNHGPGDLLLSVGVGLPMIRIEAGDTLSHNSGMSDNLFLCSAGSNPEFSLLVGSVMSSR